MSTQTLMALQASIILWESIKLSTYYVVKSLVLSVIVKPVLNDPSVSQATKTFYLARDKGDIEKRAISQMHTSEYM